jgi:hypothetical protein
VAILLQCDGASSFARSRDVPFDHGQLLLSWMGTVGSNSDRVGGGEWRTSKKMGVPWVEMCGVWLAHGFGAPASGVVGLAIMAQNSSARS